MGIENHMTVSAARDILENYCNLKGLSFEKLLRYSPYKTNREWIWVKPYEGPLIDENGCIMDLQTMPTPIISVDTTLLVHEWEEGIDLIKP
jgi:hypothetical protein